MAKTYFLDGDQLLDCAEVAGILDCSTDEVFGRCYAGHFTWHDCPDGVRRFPGSAVHSHAARMEAGLTEPDRLLTRRQAADHAGLGAATITVWQRNGWIAPVPGTRLYAESSVDAVRARLADSRRHGRVRAAAHRVFLHPAPGGLAAACACSPGDPLDVRESWTAGEAQDALGKHLEAVS